MTEREKRPILGISEDSRRVFAKMEAIISVPFVIAHWITVQLGLWTPPETLIAKFTLYWGVPLTLLSLYLTFYKKIFPKRIGDVIHSCVLIFVISTFAFSYGGRVGGDFVFLFFLLIAFSVLLMDDFIPLFIGGLTSLIVIGEGLFTIDPTHISYTPFIETFLQIIAFLIVGWVSSNLVKRTLTEQETSRRLRTAYEELKKLDKAKSEFISIASHQLRTPLTAVKGYISMILEGGYGKIPEKTQQPMENVYKSNERLIKLVNDILNVTRIETGGLEMKFEKSSLEEIIESVIEELKGVAKSKKIYLKFEKPEELLPKISIDKDKIRQVILNVVDNGIRYTEKGGVNLKIQNPESKIQIIVSDTGEGMTREELSKLFESFSRGMAGTRLYTEGVGLGLYIARKLIEMHDGKIWAESPGPGKGSTFYIELPLKL